MIGFTGVPWMSRGAARLAADLTTGAGAVPTAAAAQALAQLEGALAQAAAELSSAGATLGAEWQGGTADAAVRTLAGCAAWLTEAATAAAGAAATAGTAAGAYGVALAAMPSLAEVGQTQVLKAAAVTVPGAGVGALAAAEAAERAQDLRAAAAMVAYEAACSGVTVPLLLSEPPQLVAGPTAGPGGAMTALTAAAGVVREALAPTVAAQTGALVGGGLPGGGALASPVQAVLSSVGTVAAQLAHGAGTLGNLTSAAHAVSTAVGAGATPGAAVGGPAGAGVGALAAAPRAAGTAPGRGGAPTATSTAVPPTGTSTEAPASAAGAAVPAAFNAPALNAPALGGSALHGSLADGVAHGVIGTPPGTTTGTGSGGATPAPAAPPGTDRHAVGAAPLAPLHAAPVGDGQTQQQRQHRLIRELELLDGHVVSPAVIGSDGS